jgi:hypothetical protein
MVEKHFAELVGRGTEPKARACRLLNLYISMREPARRHFAQLLDSKNKYVVSPGAQCRVYTIYK